jgi:hypothetical protein
MCSPEQLIRELCDVPDLIAAQVHAGLDKEEVLEALFRSWASRLSTIGKMSDKHKALVTNCITEGPWTSQQVKDLACIVLQGSATKRSSSKMIRRSNQKVLHIENYIPMNIMAKLRDTKFSRLSRASMLAQVARSIGIELPDQPSLFRMVALLAFMEDNWSFTQEDVFSFMDRIQEFVKAVPRNASIPWLEHYPVSAADLPEDMRKALYPSGDLPVVVEMPELDTILKGHKMKGRDMGKKAKPPPWLAAVPEEHRESVMASIRQQGASSSQAATAPSPSASASSATRVAHTAEIFRFQPPAQPKQTLPLHAPKPEEHEEAELDEEDSEKNEPANDGTIDAFEAAMVAAVNERVTKRKAKDKASKGKAKADPSKKPAAAAAALKRPAAVAATSPKKASVMPYKKSKGCIRCRGSRNGCSSCRKPSFGGWRCTRDEYFAAGYS